MAFIERLEWDDVFRVMHGADFMQIPALVDLAAARLASRICQWSKEKKEASRERADGHNNAAEWLIAFFPAVPCYTTLYRPPARACRRPLHCRVGAS